MAGALTIERIRSNKDWPKLKCKGAAARHLAAFGLELAVDYSKATDHDRLRIALAEMLVRFYEILDGEGRFLSPRALNDRTVIYQPSDICYSSHVVSGSLGCWTQAVENGSKIPHDGTHRGEYSGEPPLLLDLRR